MSRALILLLFLPLLGCSFTRFELSPYAPRGLDVIYSAQEDLTFFVWRLRPEARLKEVHFELAIDGDYLPLDLSAAPFPHEPFACDRIYICFQYQLPGKWEPPPTSTAPLLAVDKRHGVFHSPPARFQEVPQTFSIDPLAANNNAQALPTLDDWFSENEIPLKRDFQWVLTEMDGGPQDACSLATTSDWKNISERVNLPQNWTPHTPCFVVRPRRHDAPGAQTAARLIPGPMLYTQRIQDRLPVIDHPTILAILVDLQVTNRERCQRIIDQISAAIYNELDEEKIPYEPIGIFRPVQGAQEDSGCQQDPNSRYPMDLILDEARRVRAPLTEDATLLVVYLNNIELPPSELKLLDLQQILQVMSGDEGFSLLTWSIGSNLINGLWPWDLSTPWGPIEDRNFLPSVRATITHQLPLRTTDLPGWWHLELPKPNASKGPQYFKICSFSPAIMTLEAADDIAWSDFDLPRRWPDSGEPLLAINLQEQVFVPSEYYRPVDYSGVYEVCDDFCDNPFPGPNGTRYDSWLGTKGSCQWN